MAPVLPLLLLAISFPLLHAADSPPRIKTSSGLLIGRPSSWLPQTTEYLGIPYGQPPVGPLRFAAPVPFKSNDLVNATEFGLECPQNVGRRAAFHVSESEACLFLNVWTRFPGPAAPAQATKKAVIILISGRAFNSGETRDPDYSGVALADKHDVVVVTMNYRVNIFGFPMLPTGNGWPEGQYERNPGLLDQRLAVEWVKNNIEAFGGDPKRMILVGQAAGGASVDMYSHAYPSDPIVKGFIAQSGLAADPAVPNGNISAPWWIASSKLGCGGIEAGPKTLECVRSKDWREVLDIVDRPSVIADALAPEGFVPAADGKTVFQDYAKRRAEGKFAKLPLLVGNTDYERGFFEMLADAGGVTLPPSALPAGLDGCDKHAAAIATLNVREPAWRYLFAATFSDREKGAGRGSDIPYVLGTWATPESGITPTDEKVKLSETLGKAWTDFAKDPENGLKKLGWPIYQALESTLITLGGRNSAAIKFDVPRVVDAACPWTKQIVVGGSK